MAKICRFRPRNKPNPRAAKIKGVFRNLMAQGFTDEAMLISAASDAIGGDDAAEFAAHIWRTHFRATEAN